MSDIDDRITAALRAAANQVSDADLAPVAPPTTSLRPRRPVRWIAPVIAAAAVAAIAITVTTVGSSHPSASRSIAPGDSPTLSVTASTTGALTNTTPPASTAATYVCYFADASPCRVPAGFVWYVPLWPFANYAQAKQWQGSGGSQPWHLDAAQTALNFTQNYLGFTDITRVTSQSITADQAQIGVGYLNPAGKPVTAAVLHLVRYENAPNTKTAAWEVVGSEDTTLSLETPKYDSTVGDNFTAGGHISGVDENLHLWLRTLDYAPAVVDDCCLPAGGDKQPWSRRVGIAQLAILGPKVAVPMTLIVSTGGHVQQHERFAIQGIYVSVTQTS